MIYDNIALVLSYAIIGYGLKYIDEVYDEGVYNKKIALLFVVVCSIFISYLSAIDNYSMAIFFAIIFGVAIGGKIDNNAFKTGVALTISLTFLMKYFFLHTDMIEFSYFVFFVLLIMCVLDEELDKEGHKKGKKIHKTRPFMKITIFLLWMSQSITGVYVLAFFAFDIAYEYIRYKPMRVYLI
ncbi:MAG: hypothetical protein KAQ92_01220 [Candidatus Aenigmarchaeota archaeon]|nr:hypothetical protein [Candidatus Aenigmarchaeota archaeon]